MRTPHPDHNPADTLRNTVSSYPPAQPRWQRAQSWTLSVIRSFGYAFAGIWMLLRTQRNAQIHLFITVIVVAASLAWRISRVEWLALILTITLVLSMEAINTAVESVVDLASPQFHPLAKRAKDVAAGGVLLVAIGAACVALLLYGQRLWALLWLLIG